MTCSDIMSALTQRHSHLGKPLQLISCDILLTNFEKTNFTLDHSDLYRCLLPAFTRVDLV